MTPPTVIELPGNRWAVEGTLADCGNAVALAHANGRLANASDPTPVAPGRYVITIRLREPVQARYVPPPRPRRRALWWTVGAVAAVVLVAGLGVLVAIVGAVAVVLGASALIVAIAYLSTRSRGRTFSGTFHGRMH